MDVALQCYEWDGLDGYPDGMRYRATREVILYLFKRPLTPLPPSVLYHNVADFS